MTEPKEPSARPPLMVNVPTLLIRLHRHLHTTPVEGCKECEERAKLRAKKVTKT